MVTREDRPSRRRRRGGAGREQSDPLSKSQGGRAEKEATQPKTEAREPRAVGVEMSSSFWGKGAETTVRGSVRFAKAEVVAEIVVASKKSHTSAEGKAVEGQ